MISKQRRKFLIAIEASALSMLLCLPLCAQSTTPANTTDTVTFYGAGLTVQAQSSPKPSGWAVVATEINKSAQLYSLSESDFLSVNGRIQSSVRTGFAVPISVSNVKLPWNATLYGLFDGGVATNGTASGLAYSGGAVALIPVTMGSTKLDVILGVRVLKTNTGGTQLEAEIGFGKGGAK